MLMDAVERVALEVWLFVIAALVVPSALSTDTEEVERFVLLV